MLRLTVAILGVVAGVLLAMWCVGNAVGVLFTGRFSILSDAAGPIVFYVLLAVIVIPICLVPSRQVRGEVIGRDHLRYIFGAFWICAAVLQLQSFWWRTGEIGGVIRDNIGHGGLDGVLLDSSLRSVASFVGPAEIPVNTGLILICLGLGLALLLAPRQHAAAALACTMVVGLAIWLAAQAAGLILSGATTDFDSGLLLVVVALACWP